MDQGLHLSDARYKRLLAKIAMLEAATEVVGESVTIEPFSFLSASPVALGTVLPGGTVDRVAVLIGIPFDDPTATLRVGSTVAPSSLLAHEFIVPTMIGQYEDPVMVHFAGGASLILTISPGASTQGAGMVLVKWKD